MILEVRTGFAFRDGVQVSLADRTVTDDQGQDDTLSNIENLSGSVQDDPLIGNASRHVMKNGDSTDYFYFYVNSEMLSADSDSYRLSPLRPVSCATADICLARVMSASVAMTRLRSPSS